jgi:hypothetical protein
MDLDCFDIIPLVLHVCVFVRSLFVRSFVRSFVCLLFALFLAVHSWLFSLKVWGAGRGSFFPSLFQNSNNTNGRIQ